MMQAYPLGARHRLEHEQLGILIIIKQCIYEKNYLQII